MNLHTLAKTLALVLIGAALFLPETLGQSLGSMFQMMGGMDAIGKLSGNFLQSSASDPRLSGLMGKVDTNAVAPKLSDQMCSMLGGSCKAPLSDQQIAAGAAKLDDTQTKALGDNFSSALKNLTSNPLVREGVSKIVAPKLGGIMGALL